MPAAIGKRKPAAIAFIKPQLATLVDDAPVGANWLQETKYDGYRMQAHVRDGKTVLYSRNALDWSHKFPDIRDELSDAIGKRTAVLDGEIVVNSGGQASFHALQSALSDKTTSKARFVVFDALYFDGHDLRLHPLSQRREVLEALIDTFPAKRRIQISKLLRGTAANALAKACAAGGEGIICKMKNAPYTSGRSNGWVKVKCGSRQEMVIIGYSEPKGSREGIGALLLGVYEAKKVLRYSGRVGTGFSTRELTTLRQALSKIETDKSPLSVTADMVAVRESGKVQWVQPKLVAEVSFTEWTSDGLLRHPVFQGLREDKKPTDIKREEPA